MNKRNNIIIAGIVGVAFILFVIFVYLPYADKQENLNKVKQSYQHSSFLRDSLNHIPDFTCVDQNGKTFTKKDVAETVFVAEFFYTECDAYCPVILFASSGCSLSHSSSGSRTMRETSATASREFRRSFV